MRKSSTPPDVAPVARRRAHQRAEQVGHDRHAHHGAGQAAQRQAQAAQEARAGDRPPTRPASSLMPQLLDPADERRWRTGRRRRRQKSRLVSTPNATSAMPAPSTNGHMLGPGQMDVGRCRLMRSGASRYTSDKTTTQTDIDEVPVDRHGFGAPRGGGRPRKSPARASSAMMPRAIRPTRTCKPWKPVSVKKARGEQVACSRVTPSRYRRMYSVIWPTRKIDARARSSASHQHAESRDWSSRLQAPLGQARWSGCWRTGTR